MRPEEAYPNSFRIGFGMTTITILWWLIDGGIAPFFVALIVLLCTLFVFPMVLIWDMRRGS